MTTRTTLYLLLACVAAHAAPIHEMPSSNRSFKRNNDDDEGVAWKDMTPAQRGGWIAGFTIFGVFFVVVLTAMLVGWYNFHRSDTIYRAMLRDHRCEATGWWDGRPRAERRPVGSSRTPSDAAKGFRTGAFFPGTMAMLKNAASSIGAIPSSAWGMVKAISASTSQFATGAWEATTARAKALFAKKPSPIGDSDMLVLDDVKGDIERNDIEKGSIRKVPSEKYPTPFGDCDTASLMTAESTIAPSYHTHEGDIGTYASCEKCDCK